MQTSREDRERWLAEWHKLIEEMSEAMKGKGSLVEQLLRDRR